jgi:ubiquinone biosynthesis monooxygenase Coq7
MPVFLYNHQMINPDRFILFLDRGLRTVYAQAQPMRKTPAAEVADQHLEKEERALSCALMRVNHSGEICAQALYQGQALTAHSLNAKHSLEQAAQEEIDHLSWTEERIKELGGRKSLLNPLWYAGSFVIGAAAGLSGDKWSLGFLAETEHQVERHLDKHLLRLPEADHKSQAILKQMKLDEMKHATSAITHGAKPLPSVVKLLMQLSSKLMTKTAYRV